MIEDLGMPIHGTIEFGRLFVAFKVIFPVPGSLDSKAKKDIFGALPETKYDKEEPEINEDDEQHMLETVSKKSFGKNKYKRSRNAYDSDDEDEYVEVDRCQQM